MTGKKVRKYDTTHSIHIDMRHGTIKGVEGDYDFMYMTIDNYFAALYIYIHVGSNLNILQAPVFFWMYESNDVIDSGVMAMMYPSEMNFIIKSINHQEFKTQLNNDLDAITEE